MSRYDFPDNATMGMLYDPATVIQDPSEAQEYLGALIVRRMRVDGMTRDEAEQLERGNIGYYAGYMDYATMARMLMLFKTIHPVYSSAKNAYGKG